MIDPALISTERLMSDLDQLLGLPGSPGEAEELGVVAARVAALMRGHGLQVTTIGAPAAAIVVTCKPCPRISAATRAATMPSSSASPGLPGRPSS